MEITDKIISTKTSSVRTDPNSRKNTYISSSTPGLLLCENHRYWKSTVLHGKVRLDDDREEKKILRNNKTPIVVDNNRFRKEVWH